MVVQRFAAAVVNHPEWLCFIGAVMAVGVLFLRLGSADDGILSRWISSDTLWPVDVFVDIFQDHYSISGWRFSIAPFWFPDLVVTGVFWGVTRNPILATLLAGCVQTFAIVGGFHLVGRVVGLQKLYLQDTLMLLSSAGLTLIVATEPGRNYPNYQLLFIPEGHVGNMLLVLYGWGMALWIIREQRRGMQPRLWLMVVYAITCVLAGMSNLFFFPHMLVSLTVALALAIFFGLMTLRQCWLAVAVGWMASSLGAILNRVLFSSADVGVQRSRGLEPVLTAIDVFTRGFLSRLLAGDMLHAAAVLWVAICIGYIGWFIRGLVLRGLSQMAESDLFKALFFAMCLTASTVSVAAIVFGGSNGLTVFKDYVWSMHYLHQTFFMPIFGLAMCGAWLIAWLVPNRAQLAVAWAITAIVLFVSGMRILTTPWPKTAIYAYQPPLVRFVDQIATEKKLRYGYAGYWQSRLITLLSRSQVRAYAVDGSMNPLLWANNSEWYRESVEDRNKRPHVDFVVLDDPLWKLTREAAVRAFGNPVSETEIQGTRILLYAGQK